MHNSDISLDVRCLFSFLSFLHIGTTVVAILSTILSRPHTHTHIALFMPEEMKKQFDHLPVYRKLIWIKNADVVLTAHRHFCSMLLTNLLTSTHAHSSIHTRSAVPLGEVDLLSKHFVILSVQYALGQNGIVMVLWFKLGDIGKWCIKD